MESTIEVDRAVCAMFLFQGWDRIQPSPQSPEEANWQRAVDEVSGQVGVADYLSQFSFTLANLLAEGLEKHGEAPGVFDYEVSFSVGQEIAGYALREGYLPPHGVVRATMIEPINEAFWRQ